MLTLFQSQVQGDERLQEPRGGSKVLRQGLTQQQQGPFSTGTGAVRQLARRVHPGGAPRGLPEGLQRRGRHGPLGFHAGAAARALGQN